MDETDNCSADIPTARAGDDRLRSASAARCSGNDHPRVAGCIRSFAEKAGGAETAFPQWRAAAGQRVTCFASDQGSQFPGRISVGCPDVTGKGRLDAATDRA